KSLGQGRPQHVSLTRRTHPKSSQGQAASRVQPLTPPCRGRSQAGVRLLVLAPDYERLELRSWGTTMNFDEEKIDRTVLALLYLTLHDENRAWKSFDWDVMNRLHAQGLISDPVGKAKSVALTEKGLEEAKRLCQ